MTGSSYPITKPLWIRHTNNPEYGPISGIIPATGPSTFYFDTSPDPANEFYQVQLVQ